MVLQQHASTSLLERVDFFRLDAVRQLNPQRRVELGQFMTPGPLAQHMAALLHFEEPVVSLLDAGAGVGSLISATVETLCERSVRPETVRVTAYEIDPLMLAYLEETLQLCAVRCAQAGIDFAYEIIAEDFVKQAVEQLGNPLFTQSRAAFTAAILNPPYRKIHSDSLHRRLLRQAGIETSNLYTGFLALAIKLLAPGGELVAITPRSFCNGPYFRPFRKLLLAEMALREFHLFESREQAFHEDEVLQENIILSAVKGQPTPETVTITVSLSPDDDFCSVYEVPYERVVNSHDPQRFIHLVADPTGEHVASQVTSLPATLAKLGLSVSTGRVVDFRAAKYLRRLPDDETAPLLYPGHLSGNTIVWPRTDLKKPNALVYCEATRNLFVANDYYVLVKRFSAKEERKRITAVVYTPEAVNATVVGFENHLNYFHLNGRGLDAELAYGLAAYLNSTIVDRYFRQFNGHTQVNATDLRNLRYPSWEQLCRLGRRVGGLVLCQEELDTIVAEESGGMGEDSEDRLLRIKKRIDEALTVLRELGFPRSQLNERSALTLLALLNLKPEMTWAEATNPLCGITPMMEFFARYYDKNYKPNTRETVRRQTVHQFVDGGLALLNPDNPLRPINSPHSVYQIGTTALRLLQLYGSQEWSAALQIYLTGVKTLREQYAREREMQRIPIRLSTGESFTLAPGGQNELIRLIIDEFAPRFTPGGEVIYVGDTDDKFAFFDQARLHELGVTIETHGKMPDVIIYHTKRDWLVLIEAVTSHGPIDAKRRGELARLFQATRAGLVYVTAFLNRRALKEYLPDISWETEVWVAESPSHMIHFNGERFLGPHPDQ